MIATIVQVVGLVMVFVGVACWSIPAALIVAGLAVVAIAEVKA